MSVEEAFWTWFTENQELLLGAKSGDEDLFDRLAEALQKVDRNLTFEFGPRGQVRDFVVSAGGIRSSFPAAFSLVNAAPKLARWNVIALRPRRVSPGIVEFRNKHADPHGVQFSLLNNGKIAGLRLFIPDFQEGDLDWMQIGYLILDSVLGEYDVQSRIGFLKMYPPEAQTNERRYPLAELPSAFDDLMSRLEGANRPPS